MTARAAVLIVATGACAAATAQTPSFVYSIHVAKPTLAPGETTTVTVLCAFAPRAGSMVMTPFGLEPVHGLSSGSFDLAATAGGWTLGPPPSGSLITPYNFVGTTQGLASGSTVTGVIWGNGFGPPLGVVSSLNPTPLWNATFTAPASGLVMLQVAPVGLHGLWVGSNFTTELLGSNTTGAQAVINVIPAPSAIAIVALAGAGAARRRRRRPTRLRREVSSSAIVPSAFGAAEGDWP